MGLIGIDPEALALPPQQQAAAMHICSLDERAWFDRSMVLEAQAASSNPNPNPNPKPNPDPNPNPNPNPSPSPNQVARMAALVQDERMRAARLGRG